MAREFTGPYRRRDFLRMTTALGALGITTSLTPELVYAQAKTDLSGVEIDYWNMIGVQNKLVRQLSETIIKAFEQKTGATVNTTWNSYGDIIGPKYRTNFQGGVKPVVFDATDRWTGQLRVPLPDERVHRRWVGRRRAEQRAVAAAAGRAAEPRLCRRQVDL